MKKVKIDLSNQFIDGKFYGDLIVKKDKIFPKKLEVFGNLSLISGICSLPNELYVHDDLNIQNRNIQKLPTKLLVGKNLVINIFVKELPKVLMVKKNCTLLVHRFGYKLPEKLHIGGYLTIDKPAEERTSKLIFPENYFIHTLDIPFGMGIRLSEKDKGKVLNVRLDETIYTLEEFINGPQQIMHRVKL